MAPLALAGDEERQSEPPLRWRSLSREGLGGGEAGRRLSVNAFWGELPVVT